MIAAGAPKAAILAGHFTLIGEIKAQRVWSSGHARIKNNATVQFSVQRRGLYLGFQDTGGCISLGKVRVSYNFCPAQIIAGVRYTRTSSPSARGALRVYGKCGVNSESPHNATSVYMECLSNGSWSSPNSGMTCFCKPGYQTTSQGCQGKFQNGWTRIKTTTSPDDGPRCPVSGSVYYAVGFVFQKCLPEIKRFGWLSLCFSDSNAQTTKIIQDKFIYFWLLASKSTKLIRAISLTHLLGI